MILRYIKRRFFLAYPSPLMLLITKVTKDKRVVTHFRHLDVRIEKYNPTYPLLKVTFLVLGSSRHKVLSF